MVSTGRFSEDLSPLGFSCSPCSCMGFLQVLYSISICKCECKHDRCWCLFYPCGSGLLHLRLQLPPTPCWLHVQVLSAVEYFDLLPMQIQCSCSLKMSLPKPVEVLCVMHAVVLHISGAASFTCS